jgi:MoaA/NifB/PqqE/SkfB family radical SAM enzyme
MLNAGLFEKVIDELHEKLSYLILYFQGEPFLHPHFADLVAYASAHNIYTATSTNAHFLSEPNAVAIVKAD